MYALYILEGGVTNHTEAMGWRVPPTTGGLYQLPGHQGVWTGMTTFCRQIYCMARTGSLKLPGQESKGEGTRLSLHRGLAPEQSKPVQTLISGHIYSWLEEGLGAEAKWRHPVAVFVRGLENW